MSDLDQWKAECARVDAERRAYVRGAGSRIQGLYYPNELRDEAARVFPYPDKPVRTVTLSTGAIYRRGKNGLERISPAVIPGRSEPRWDAAGWSLDDVRLLATLLEEET